MNFLFDLKKHLMSNEVLTKDMKRRVHQSENDAEETLMLALFEKARNLSDDEFIAQRNQLVEELPI